MARNRNKQVSSQPDEAINEGLEQVEDTVAEESAPANARTVEIPESQLNAILLRLDELENSKDKGITRPKRVTEHTAFLRLWNNQLVIGYEGKPVEILNKETLRRELYIKLLLTDGKKESTELTNYLLFLNESTRVNVKILKQEAKEFDKSEGKTSRVDEKTDKVVENEIIELKVNYIDYVSDVKVDDEEAGEYNGLELTIANKFLNL